MLIWFKLVYTLEVEVVGKSKLQEEDFQPNDSRYAAKSCDEIGRLTANLAVNNLWDTTIDRKLMQLQWKQKWKVKYF